MLTIDKILRLDCGIGSWSTEKGMNASAPTVAIGLRARLRMDLRQAAFASDSTLLPIDGDSLADIVSWYLAIDGDFNQATAPVIYDDDPPIVIIRTADARTCLEWVLPDTRSDALIAAARNAKSVTLQVEIGGYDAEAHLGFLAQFPLQLRNRVYVEGGDVPPEVQSDPDYLTAAEVRALIAEAVRSEVPGPAGKSAYELAVDAGYGGTLPEWLASLRASDGDPGAAGRSAYELAVDAGYEGTLPEWLASLRGEGASAYELAVAGGFSGTVAEWLESLRGDAGQDLKPDATGNSEDRALYDDEPAGFLFGASTYDETRRCTTVLYYAKRSGDHADWCDPMTVVYYETPARIVAYDPIEFSAPGANADYLGISLDRYPASTVAAVVIDTEAGELTLPLGSAAGVRKIERDRATGACRIYFGSAVPEFETGRVYLTQFLGIEESAVPTAELKMYYGYVFDPDVWRLDRLPQADLDHVSTVRRGQMRTLGRTGLGVLPAGALAFVLVPAASGLAAYKDDGFHGKASFAADNGGSGTGGNGVPVTIDGAAYLAYGEFVLVSGEMFVYVDQEG